MSWACSCYSYDINTPVPFKEYEKICQDDDDLNYSIVDETVVGPAKVSFARTGRSPEVGFKMQELLNPRYRRYLRGATDKSIKVFLDGGVEELRLVIWGPATYGGPWHHHVRTIPVEGLKTKADLGFRVAATYEEFCNRSRGMASIGGHSLMHFGDLNLVSVKRRFGNVYEAELYVNSD